MRKLSKRYWDSLSIESRYRALRKVFSNFSDSINRSYAQDKAKDIDPWMWDIIVRHVKRPINSDHYKTIIDHTWIP